MTNDERSVTARLPVELVQKLEDCRYRISKATGKRVSTKAIVKEALERFIDIIEAKLEQPPKDTTK